MTLVAIGVFCAVLGTLAVLITVIYRLVLFEQYAVYRAEAQSAGRSFSWWRFIHYYHRNLFLVGSLKPMHPLQSLMIWALAILPLMLLAHYLSQ